MVVLGCLILLFWLGILPILVGSICAGKGNSYNNSIMYRFMAGNILLWAVFHLICVPCVIGQKSFTLVVDLYLAATAVLLIIGVFCVWKKRILISVKNHWGKSEKFCWLIFGILLLIQLVCAVVLAYADGDDAFYVAVSEITNDSNTMYQKSPYSTGVTELDVRHGLAPFPIWISFLARISGMHTAVIAHVVVAVYLIIMSYGAFYLVGSKVLEEKQERVPLFMIFMALLVLFGDYSTRTPENFMIARSRQGKAAIGSILIPMLIFLLLVILKKVQEEKKVEWNIWLLLASTVTAACLCTTLGTFLSCMMIGCVGICSLFVYKKLKPVIWMALCCSPAVCFALLYFVLG